MGRGRSGRIGVARLSGNNAPRATLLQQHQTQIQRLSGDEYPDGTYNVDTLTPVDYSDGFQVTFCQIGDNYNDSEYAALVERFRGASSDGIVSAGKFEGTPEISFHVSSREVAEQLAREFNQISIWDWNACDSIDTGGTGRRR